MLGHRPSGCLILLHHGRSGSTVVGDLMNQHPDVHWDGEIFHQALRSGIDAPVDPLRHLRNRMLRAGKKICCGEIKLTHLRQLDLPPEKLLEEASRIEASVVILERRNYLRRIISSLIVKQTHYYHLAASQQLEPRPFAIDVDHVMHHGKSLPLLAHLDDLEQNCQSLRQLAAKETSLRLIYEEDVEGDPTVAYQKLCRLMGLAPHNVRVRLRRVNRGELSHLIVNYDEVKAYLDGTPYAWMLDA